MANHTMKMANLLLLVTLAQLLATAISSDPDLLQDLCVADLASGTTPFASLYSPFPLYFYRAEERANFHAWFIQQVGSAPKILQKISCLIFYSVYSIKLSSASASILHHNSVWKGRKWSLLLGTQFVKLSSFKFKFLSFNLSMQ